QHFLDGAAGNGVAKRLSRDALRQLLCYSWPGNIRELQNFVRSIALFVPGTVIEGEHIEQFQDFFSDGEMGELTPALVEVLDDTMNSRARSLLDTELPENELADEAAERPAPEVSGTNADVDPEVAVVDNVIRGEF